MQLHQLALERATAWAESAERCYRRAARARDDGLRAATDRETQDSQIETALAHAWAAIALAAKE